jgi:hypothetical protein
LAGHPWAGIVPAEPIPLAENIYEQYLKEIREEGLI